MNGICSAQMYVVRSSLATYSFYGELFVYWGLRLSLFTVVISAGSIFAMSFDDLQRLKEGFGKKNYRWFCER